MTPITKKRIANLIGVSLILGSIALGWFFSFWYILIALFVFYFGLRVYKRRLTDMRDNANFRTVRGKALIAECNRRLDLLNGYGIFKIK